ncbi:hypothetical protein AB0L80_41745 [Streptomyces sp. NPDC052069]|uniref:hypothetical protein n=1 Tax=Streptomyces sp. NPDC052069 TaxID=3154650 RepID=UPI00342DD3A2
MSTITARAAATAAAVVVAAFVATTVPASASTTELNCLTFPVGGASVDFGGTLAICESSDTQQTRITGTISGMPERGGRITIRIGTHKKTVSVCGVEDKTINTGWQAGVDNQSISQGPNGCPSTG